VHACACVSSRHDRVGCRSLELILETAAVRRPPRVTEGPVRRAYTSFLHNLNVARSWAVRTHTHITRRGHVEAEEQHMRKRTAFQILAAAAAATPAGLVFAEDVGAPANEVRELVRPVAPAVDNLFGAGKFRFVTPVPGLGGPDADVDGAFLGGVFDPGDGVSWQTRGGGPPRGSAWPARTPRPAGRSVPRTGARVPAGRTAGRARR
jgi:hypothetical protein